MNRLQISPEDNQAEDSGRGLRYSLYTSDHFDHYGRVKAEIVYALSYWAGDFVHMDIVEYLYMTPIAGG